MANDAQTSTHDSDDSHHNPILEVTLVLFLTLFIGQNVKIFTSWIGLPYTSIITVLGLLAGLFHESLGRLDSAVVTWSNMDPHLLLMIFLPALIFESAFNSDWHIFKHEIWKVLLMAGPMLLLATGLAAVMIYYALGYQSD